MATDIGFACIPILESKGGGGGCFFDILAQGVDAYLGRVLIRAWVLICICNHMRPSTIKD